MSVRSKTSLISLVVLLTAAGCGTKLSQFGAGISTPVPETSQPGPAITTVELTLGKRATASNSANGQAPENAIDGDINTTWRAGAAPEQWIQVDLGAPTTVTAITLVVYQPESGQTVHRILAGSSEDDLQLIHEFSGETFDRQELEFTPLAPLANIRYIRVVTVAAPGWVAWREIRVQGVPVQVTAGPAELPAADVIYTNATILTMETDAPTAEAIALQGDHILAVGSTAEVMAYQGDATRVIDLHGLTLTPGFIDSHEHRIGDRWHYGNPPVSQVFYEIMKEGYTGIHEMWVDSGRLNELVSFDSQGQIPVRVSMYLKMNSEFTIDNWWQAYQPLHQYSPYLQIAGLKITLDREWGQQVFISDQQALDELVKEGTSRGWQVATHSFSPQADGLILNAYGNALNGGSNDSLRLRLEHIGVITDPELQQMADLHIIGSVQLVSTSAWVDDPSFKTQIPADEVQLSGRWRDMINAGIFLIGNTDAPWCCTDWRNNFAGPSYFPDVPHTIYQGVTRTTFSGRQPEAWQVAQVVTVPEALEMMTIRSAYAAHQEDVIGSLKPGKYADLVILSANPLTTPVAQIPNLQVVMTMVGGRIGYCAAGYESVCAATTSP